MAMSTKRFCMSLSISIAAIFLALSLSILPLAGLSTEDASASPGSGWEDQSLNYTFYDADRHGVAAVDADNVWVVGDEGSILRTNDGGITWEQQSSGSPYGIEDISAVDGDVAWAAGYRTVLRTTNGGETWEKKGEGLPYSSANEIFAVDADTVWVAFYSSLIKTTDGGVTWTTVYQGGTYGFQIHDLYAEDADTVWAVGVYSELIEDRAEYTASIFKTTDGGANWALAYSDPDLYGFCSISSHDSSVIWVLSSEGVIIKTTDGGGSWIPAEYPYLPGGALYHLSAVDADTLWALGSASNDRRVYRTTDGAASWELLRSSEEGMWNLGAVDQATAWVVGEDGLILKTSNGGQDWSYQIETSMGLRDDLICVSAVDADNAWAASREIVFKTTDGGENWTEVSRSYEYDITVYDLYAVDENNVWVVGGQSGNGVIYRTSDGGNSWALQYYYFSPPYFTTVSAVDETTAWVAGANGVMERTSDGGNTWINQYSGTSRELSSIEAIDANRAWAVGWSVGYTPTYWMPSPPYVLPIPFYPIILKTVNGGNTWTANQTGTYKEGFNDIAASDAYNAIAVGVDINYSPIPVLVYVFDGPMYYGLAELSRYGAMVTHDEGNTWSPQVVNIGYSIILNAVDMVDTETAWEVGHWAILKTTDGGTTSYSQATAPHYLRDVDAVDASTAWAVGDDGTIMKTTDGGDARPDIVSIAPSSGQVGTEVTISGCDFGDTRGSSSVTFGGIAATEYPSWSNTQIKVKVPSGVAGEVKAIVSTSAGASNGMAFETPYSSTVTATSIIPNQVLQNTVSLEITDLAGTGFIPGATVRLEKGTAVINTYNVNVVSGNKITCTIGFLGVEPGVYDVVVTNPDAQEARLPSAFTVTSQCGSGSGAALLMLGLSLGLLSLAGSVGLKRKRGK